MIFKSWWGIIHQRFSQSFFHASITLSSCWTSSSPKSPLSGARSQNWRPTRGRRAWPCPHQVKSLEVINRTLGLDPQPLDVNILIPPPSPRKKKSAGSGDLTICEQVSKQNVDPANQEEETILSCQPNKKAAKGRNWKKTTPKKW